MTGYCQYQVDANVHAQEQSGATCIATCDYKTADGDIVKEILEFVQLPIDEYSVDAITMAMLS